MIATSSAHSNAFNFLGFMQGGVDPRTGQYTLGIELPKIVANNLIGWIGTLYEKMLPVQFWALHAAIAATGGMLVLLLGRRLSRAVVPGAGQPLRPSAMTHEVER